MNISGGLKTKINKRLKEASVRFVTILALFLFFIPNATFALSQQEAQDEIDRINQENQQLSGQVNQKKQQANSIASQIRALSDNISQTQYEINKANSRIVQLSNDITKTEEEIKTEEIKLKDRQEQIGIFIAESYESGQQSMLEVVASTKNFSEFINRAEYLEQMQIRVKEEAEKITEIRNSLKTKNEQLALNKTETENTKRELLAKQSDIQSQRSVQNYFLNMTNAEKTQYETDISNNNSRKGLIWCIAYPELCKSNDTNGEIVVTNSFSPYYNQMAYPWGSYKYAACWDCTIYNYGCLITSLSMVRSYFGNPTNPITEATYHSYDYNGNMLGWDFAGRPRVSISKSQIGSYLTAGKPVIVKLSMGGYTHFIALFATNGSVFYANDPAFGAGHTYSLSRVLAAYSY